ncbi:unnamed protein product [Cladocopium goreaui]|uniref:Uncharacterized protein n=1 Tax=Cladocopium goreaui TaxID=2562237 RepID=A0A9P1BNF6_9DINO|nr:unnamed protein product [Cladocopium goreaui]|mmetsp:Transcript_5991/g.12533  ORF Transcript_5991/g.12533 Transcript_5991/m.12533 type:complete len:118 (+) Transcript_5991:56-409(+)
MLDIIGGVALVAISWRWLRKNGCSCLSQEDDIGGPPVRFAEGSQGLAGAGFSGSSGTPAMRGLKQASTPSRLNLKDLAKEAETPRGDKRARLALQRKVKSAQNLSGSDSVHSGRMGR